MMTEYVYIVHSDVDENNVYQEFDTFDEALEYAKGYDNGLTFQTYIDQVEVNKDDYGSIELGESERVWSYLDELNEELTRDTNLDLTADDLAECGGSIIKEDDLTEETHAHEPQPETDHRAAFNAALKIAQENDKPVIYGYHGADHHGSARAFTIEPIVCDDLRASTLTAMKKYHPSGSLFVAYPNQEFVEEVCSNCESLEDTVEADLKDVWDPNEDTYELYFNDPFDANEMRKHEKICEDADFNPDDVTADYWDAESMKYEDEFKELNGEARYRIENDDPRMPDFKIYEADYNIKCDLVSQALGSEDGVDVWEISGREQDILDFINEYGLEYVSERLDESFAAEEKAFEKDLDEVDFSDAYDFNAMREALREAEGEDDEELDEVDEVDAVEATDESEVEAAAIIEEKPEDVDVKVDVVIQGTDELSDKKIIDAIEEIAADNKKLDDDMRIVTDVVTIEPENTEVEDKEDRLDEDFEGADAEVALEGAIDICDDLLDDSLQETVRLAKAAAPSSAERQRLRKELGREGSVWLNNNKYNKNTRGLNHRSAYLADLKLEVSKLEKLLASIVDIYGENSSKAEEIRRQIENKTAYIQRDTDELTREKNRAQDDFAVYRYVDAKFHGRLEKYRALSDRLYYALKALGFAERSHVKKVKPSTEQEIIKCQNKVDKLIADLEEAQKKLADAERRRNPEEIEKIQAELEDQHEESINQCKLKLKQIKDEMAHVKDPNYKEDVNESKDVPVDDVLTHSEEEKALESDVQFSAEETVELAVETADKVNPADGDVEIEDENSEAAAEVVEKAVEAKEEDAAEEDEDSEELTEAVERVFKIYTVFDDKTEIDQIKKGIKPAQLRKLMRDAACADDVLSVYASEIIDGKEHAMDKYTIENKKKVKESIEDVKQLEKEEEDAIDSYDKHIDNADSEKEAEVYSHIKEEEKEHLSELSDLEGAVKALEEIDIEESLNLAKSAPSEHETESASEAAKSLHEEAVAEDFKQCTGAGNSDTSIQCSFCGKVHPVTDMKEMTDGVWKCKDCENEDLVAGCAEKECKKNPVIAHEKSYELRESLDSFWLDTDAFDLDF